MLGKKSHQQSHPAVNSACNNDQHSKTWNHSGIYVVEVTTCFWKLELRSTSQERTHYYYYNKCGQELMAGEFRSPRENTLLLFLLNWHGIKMPFKHLSSYQKLRASLSLMRKVHFCNWAAVLDLPNAATL